MLRYFMLKIIFNEVIIFNENIRFTEIMLIQIIIIDV